MTYHNVFILLSMGRKHNIKITNFFERRKKELQQKNGTFQGMARKRSDGRWWFCTRQKQGYKYHWPISNSTSITRVGQVIHVIKRSHQDYCIIPEQLKLFIEQ
jgi:hypothetical protein